MQRIIELFFSKPPYLTRAVVARAGCMLLMILGPLFVVGTPGCTDELSVEILLCSTYNGSPDNPCIARDEPGDETSTATPTDCESTGGTCVDEPADGFLGPN